VWQEEGSGGAAPTSTRAGAGNAGYTTAADTGPATTSGARGETAD
jgi:hypothetical protein